MASPKGSLRDYLLTASRVLWAANGRDQERNSSNEDHTNRGSDLVCRTFQFLQDWGGLEGLKVPPVPPSRQFGSGTPSFSCLA
jgi:hypothetical protein